MAKVYLTRSSDGANIVLEDDLILRIFTADSLTRVEYLDDVDGFRKGVSVNETLAQVGGFSKNLVKATTLDDVTFWINQSRVTSVAEISSNAVLYFDNSGSSLQRIELNITPLVWNVRVTEKLGDFAYTTFAFTAAPNVIKLTAAQGDLTAKFTAGVVFSVIGEGNSNDGIYTVVSSAFATTTNITVTETPTADASTNGYVIVNA